MSQKIKIIVLFIILVLAFSLRFYKLGSFPALNADEAAIGYNVYSLLQTGKDEHGNPWPIHFQSFNDYKPGLYFYLVLPFVRFFGLNEWSVRIPGATLGVLTVLIIYFLVKELSKKEKFALIAALLLAISPWHIHFSRGGWEVNAGTFFITAGVWLFLVSLRKPKIFILSVLSFVASLYTYHAARVVVPLLGLGLLLIYLKDVKLNLKPIVIAGLTGIILLFPLAKDVLGPAVASRAAGVGLFADPGPLNRINEQRGEHEDYQGIIPKVLHNKAVNYGLAFLENLTDHYSGEFLFLSGDEIQRNKVPETGQMYLLDLLFIAVGIVTIVKRPRGWAIILLWVVLAPFAAALTFQSPHALRSHNLVIPLIIISAYGLTVLIEWWQKRRKNLRWLGYGLIGLLILWGFARYLHLYWVHLAKEYPYSSQYGLKELMAYIKENGDRYQEIIVTDRYDQPYILFLFYLAYPPEKFQADHTLTAKDVFGFSTVRSFDKYRFETINFDEARPANPNSLIVGTDEDIPKEANIIQKIYGQNGHLYFEVVAN